MKKLRIFLGSIFTLPVLVLVPVVSAATTPGSTPASPPTSAASKGTLATRVEKYKTALLVKPTAADQAKLKLKCKDAQVKGKALATMVTTSSTARAKVYVNITGKLTTIIDRLSDADYDTATLAAQLTELTKKITQYTTDSDTYTAGLNDLNELDCVTDPIAFKAALEASRTARAASAKDMADIRIYVEQTIKPELKKASTSLAASAKAKETE